MSVEEREGTVLKFIVLFPVDVSSGRVFTLCRYISLIKILTKHLAELNQA